MFFRLVPKHTPRPSGVDNADGWRSSPDPRPRGGGRRGHVRAARRGDPSGLRPDNRFVNPPRPSAARTGSRAHGRGLCPGHRTSRGGHGDQRAGGHQHCHSPLRRLPGFDPTGRNYWPGAVTSHRHRRLPGVRHHRNHHVGHQTQFSGHRGPRHPQDGQGGLSHRHHRSTRPSAGRYPQGHRRPKEPSIGHGVDRRCGDGPARLPPPYRGGPVSHRSGRRFDQDRRTSDSLRGRRGPQGPGRRSAARTGRAERHPRGDHAYGPGCLPGRA